MELNVLLKEISTTSLLTTVLLMTLALLTAQLRYAVAVESMKAYVTSAGTKKMLRLSVTPCLALTMVTSKLLSHNYTRKSAHCKLNVEIEHSI